MSGAAVAAIGVAFGVSACAIVVLARLTARLPQDAPNQRSMHIRSVPRAGGYAIWAGFLPVALWFPPAFPGSLAGWLLPWLLIACISAADDIRGLAVGIRLFTHVVAAVWVALGLFAQALSNDTSSVGTAMAIASCALVIAWASNLYNFMDGSDGLCATMTLMGFATYGVAALAAGDTAIPYFALAAATLPFLVVNRPRATMFLGDVGSIPLGFLAASFGIAGSLTGLWPAWFPVLVFMPFIADATATLVRRVVRGERLSTAHRDHYYQRLNRLGAGHSGTLSLYAVLMAGTSVAALGCLYAAPAGGLIALGLSCVVCFIVFAAIDYHWRKSLTHSP
ncbi:MAG TPA: glycosyltransferase family 4 protein [Casimicrobiaceae bacterium]|jgi:UDP-N-acetylmuramyl pentapeptide phosphotransferase/UDP-N-acetylglucosamine-1-phosphate transferase